MDNRSQIMSNALHLFALRGYDAVGVQEIVEASKVTKPTLYHYYGSKHGLLEAILEKYFNQINQNLRLAANYHGDLPKTLTDIVSAMFQFAQDHPVFYRLQLALWFAPQDSEAHHAVERWNQEQFQILEKLFLLAVQQHGNFNNRSRTYAASFMGIINIYIGLALNGHIELDNALVYSVVHQYQHGIYS